MNTFVPLWSQVVDSTLWEEDLPVRVLFLTMMALKDPDHVIRMPFRRLCKKANMEPDVCERALKVLLEPDGKSIDHQNFEGRRIQVVDDGWLVLNGAHYQKEMQRLFLRMKKTQLQRKYREEEKMNRSGQPLPGEIAALKHDGNGDQAAADRVTTAALPAANPVAVVPDPVPAVVPVPSVAAPQPAAAGTPEPKRKLYTMDEIKRMTEAQRAQAQQGVVPGKGLFTP